MTPAGTPRLASPDVLKGAAIVLVVFNHALVWPMRAGDLPSAFLYGIAFGTVAAFASISGYLRGKRPVGAVRDHLRRRARQLLVPWLVAAPLYAAVPFAWRAVGGGPLPLGLDPGPWVLSIAFGGGPLWFLPVLFVAEAACAPLVGRVRSRAPGVIAVCGYVTIAVAASLHGESPLSLGRGTFWALTPLYVAAYWFGVRLSHAGGSCVRRTHASALVIGTMALSGGVTLLRAVVPGSRWLMWLPYALGLVGGCAALALAVASDRQTQARGAGATATRLLARAGRASLQVYITHPAFVAPMALALSGRGGALSALVVALLSVALGTWLHARTVVAA